MKQPAFSWDVAFVVQIPTPSGSPTAEQHALRSLQNLLRIDPGAFHEFVDPQSPTTSALSTAVRGNKMDAVTCLVFFCGCFFKDVSRSLANWKPVT